MKKNYKIKNLRKPYTLLLVALSLILFFSVREFISIISDGTIPNQDFPASDVGKFISPQMGEKHHNQPIVFNGYAILSGNASHDIWDISNPRSPKFRKNIKSQHSSGEAESHQLTLSRDQSGKYYMATVSGRGFDIWDVTNTLNPEYVKAVIIPNINYGDVNNGVWGLSWQGDYVYVGATNNGVYVVDVSNLNSPKVVKNIPFSRFGGVKPGPLFAMGSLLVVTTPKNNSGVATLDISDPTSPTVLDILKPRDNKSYIGGFYGKYASLINPIRLYDVTTDPSNIQLKATQQNPDAEYVAFDEGKLFLGGKRGGSEGIHIYDISNVNNINKLSRIKGRDSRWDDQFACPVGNLVIVSDDQRVGGRSVGSVMAVHKKDKDTKGPTVEYTNPVDKAENVVTTASIGISFSDWIEFKSVSELGFIVRPTAGGAPIRGKWGWLYTTLTFTPNSPFNKDTEYEVILEKDQITDLTGNPLKDRYRFTFNTGIDGSANYESPIISGNDPTELGNTINWTIDNPSNEVEYEWLLEGEVIGLGEKISPQINEVGRYNACVRVLEKGNLGNDVIYEAENADNLSGGITIGRSNAGYTGQGYADYPSSQGNNVYIEWIINENRTSESNFTFRYANGSGSDRPLNLVINNNSPVNVSLPATGNWSTYREIKIDNVTLNQGRNTIRLIANRGSQGPNIDHLKISQLSSSTENIEEAELAQASGGIVVANNNAGYTGTGYMDFPGNQGDNVKLEWLVPNATEFTTPLTFRYANGGNANRPLTLTVNDEAPITLDFSPTNGWTSWGELTSKGFKLKPGNNRIILTANAGSSGPNIDHLKLSTQSSNSGRVLESKCFIQNVYQVSSAQPKSSSAMIYDDNKLWNVNPDNNSVSVISTTNNTKTMEIPVGKSPKSLTKVGNTIWVANKDQASISVINSDTGNIIKTINLDYSSQPASILSSINEDYVFVALSATGKILKIKASDYSISDTLTINNGAPENAPKLSGMALDGQGTTLLVNRFISKNNQGEVFKVNTQNMSLTKTIALKSTVVNDASNITRGIPNYLRTITINPNNNEAWVASKKDNIERGEFRDGLPLDHQSTVRAITSRINLIDSREDLEARIDIDNSDRCNAVVFSKFSGIAFVALAGNNSISVVDAKSGSTITSFNTQKVPDALVLDETNNRLFVHNFLSRSVSIFNIGQITKGFGNVIKIKDVATVDSEILSSEVLLGKQLFYDASSTKLNQNGYMACASCHLDGSEDGQTWDFTNLDEGFRNTIDLRGRAGTGHGRLHWTANFDEIHDFENQIRVFGAGLGLMTDADFAKTEATLGNPKAGLSSQLDALNAYVESLDKVPNSPYRNDDGTLTSRALEGKRVFLNNCTACHTGDSFTDSPENVLHDIGTIKESSGSRLGDVLTGIDTPTLKGVWNTAPYLHDGSALTLEEAIAGHDGITISDDDMELLVEYVLQIDENEKNGPLSTAEYDTNEFQIYPIPARTSITIRTTKNDSEIKSGRIDFLDVNGRLVKSLIVKNLTVKNEISIEDFSAGIYFAKIKYANKQQTVKVIKI